MIEVWRRVYYNYIEMQRAKQDQGNETFQAREALDRSRNVLDKEFGIELVPKSGQTYQLPYNVGEARKGPR